MFGLRASPAQACSNNSRLCVLCGLCVRYLFLVLLGKRSNHPARIARREYSIGDIPRDHAAGADHGSRSDRDARAE